MSACVLSKLIFENALTAASDYESSNAFSAVHWFTHDKSFTNLNSM